MRGGIDGGGGTRHGAGARVRHRAPCRRRAAAGRGQAGRRRARDGEPPDRDAQGELELHALGREGARDAERPARDQARLVGRAGGARLEPRGDTRPEERESQERHQGATRQRHDRVDLSLFVPCRAAPAPGGIWGAIAVGSRRQAERGILPSLRMRFDDATVAVFSHPNHELAIFGFLQAYRPALIYLTDGGGEARVEQTRRGLASIGLLERAHFLGYPEGRFYAALLDRDTAFFAEVAGRLRGVLETLAPARVLCDAVELYNPVHDLSLPIVRAALRGAPATAVFEVPLVHQTPAPGETYEIQRAAGARAADAIAFAIPPARVDAKLRARDTIYTLLTAQMGAVVTDVPRDRLAVEVILPARAGLPAPGGGAMALRYERRARLLLARGEIERMITWADHYMPVATALLAGEGATPAAPAR